MPDSRHLYQSETPLVRPYTEPTEQAEPDQLCKLMSCVYTARSHRGGQYVTGIIVETPNGDWQHRLLPVEDWLIVPEGKGITAKQLGSLRPFLKP